LAARAVTAKAMAAKMKVDNDFFPVGFFNLTMRV
jgi:hypothetical protein